MYTQLNPPKGDIQHKRRQAANTKQVSIAIILEHLNEKLSTGWHVHYPFLNQCIRKGVWKSLILRSLSKAKLQIALTGKERTQKSNLLWNPNKKETFPKQWINPETTGEELGDYLQTCLCPSPWASGGLVMILSHPFADASSVALLSFLRWLTLWMHFWHKSHGGTLTVQSSKRIGHLIG